MGKKHTIECVRARFAGLSLKNIKHKISLYKEEKK